MFKYFSLNEFLNDSVKFGNQLARSQEDLIFSTVAKAIVLVENSGARLKRAFRKG